MSSKKTLLIGSSRFFDFVGKLKDHSCANKTDKKNRQTQNLELMLYMTVIDIKISPWRRHNTDTVTDWVLNAVTVTKWGCQRSGDSVQRLSIEITVTNILPSTMRLRLLFRHVKFSLSEYRCHDLLCSVLYSLALPDLMPVS